MKTILNKKNIGMLKELSDTLSDVDLDLFFRQDSIYGLHILAKSDLYNPPNQQSPIVCTNIEKMFGEVFDLQSDYLELQESSFRKVLEFWKSFKKIYQAVFDSPAKQSDSNKHSIFFKSGDVVPEEISIVIRKPSNNIMLTFSVNSEKSSKIPFQIDIDFKKLSADVDKCVSVIELLKS